MKKQFLALGLCASTLLIQSFPSHAADYFWVGGTGDWSDITHWATTSGGSVFHSIVPTPNDDVYFDANAFPGSNQTVTLNLSTISCRSMDWSGATGSPTMYLSTANTLEVHGSLIFIPNSTMNLDGTTKFRASSMGFTIDPAGQAFGPLVFDGLGGGWTLQDTMFSDYIYFDSGNLNTNGQYIDTYQFRSETTQSRTLDMTGSTIYIHGSSQQWKLTADNFTLISTNSLLKFYSTFNWTEMETKGSGTIDYYDIEMEVNRTLPPTQPTRAKLEIWPLSTVACNYHKVTLKADEANITGEFHVSDSLIFQAKGTVAGKNNSHIEYCKFYQSGILNGDNTYGDIILAPGSEYRFYHNTTHTINGTMLINGNCAGPVYIHAYNTGTPTNLVNNSGGVTLDNVILQDVAASGTGTFTANDAVDLGNNSGWTLNAATSRDLYWVGNDGNWGTAANWSTSSGGAGGACPPTAIDNIFFDDNSFISAQDTVRLNSPMSTCQNMTWSTTSGNPVLHGQSTEELHVYGSIACNDFMTLYLNGITKFKGGNVNTVQSSGQLFHGQLHLDGSGEWSLLDSLHVVDDLWFLQGTFKTNGHVVNTDFFYSLQSNPRTLELGSSLFRITGYNGWSMTGTNLTLNAGTSLIRFMSVQSTLMHRNTGATYYDAEFRSTGTIENTNCTFHNVYFRDFGSLDEDFNATNNAYNKVVFENDGEIINCPNSIDTLVLTPGFSYQLDEGETQTIQHLDANGSCLESIVLESTVAGNTATISSNSTAITGDYLRLQDITAIGSATFTANNSIDNGNNSGWTINPPTALDLYWVGGTGNWNDPAHWASSSGGVGGSCIPGVTDNVFFDANSFTGTNDTVKLNANGLCRNMTWNGATGNPVFAGGNLKTLQVYGSLELMAAMEITFNGILSFEATTTGQTIQSIGQYLPGYIECNGIGGAWTLLDNLSAYALDLNAGTFNTDGFMIGCNRLESDSKLARVINFENSIVEVSSGSVLYFDLENLDFQAANSLMRYTGSDPWFWMKGTASDSIAFNDMEFTGNGNGTIVNMLNNTTALFQNIRFTGPNNDARILGNSRVYGQAEFYGGGELGTNGYIPGTYRHFNYVKFHKDGTFNNACEFDTLLLSAGGTYELHEGDTQVVNQELQILGNGCFPIQLRSSTSGVVAYLSKPSGNVIGDFIIMRDNAAIGGATFYAGENSVDQSGNSGWLFNNFPGYIYGFGVDTCMDVGDSIVLSADNFNDPLSYLWSTGSTDASISVHTPGDYWLEAFYGSGCYFRDTVHVCLNGGVTLNLQFGNGSCTSGNDGWAKVNILGGFAPFQINWSNGSLADSIYNLATGTYVVTVTDSLGFMTTDSVMIQANPPLSLSGGVTDAFCHTNTGAIDISVSDGNPGFTFVWSDGSSAEDLMNVLAGNYSVVVEDALGCQDSASFTVNDPTNVTAAFTVNATTICQFDSIHLTNNTTGASSFEWLDDGIFFSNLPSPSYQFTLAGMHEVSLVADSAGCKDTLAVTITVNPQPVATITPSPSASFCDGDSLLLTASSGAGFTYQWYLNGNPVSGATNDTHNAKQGGSYTVLVMGNGCDSLAAPTVVSVTPLPEAKIMPAGPTTFCSGDSVVLNANQGGSFSYQWFLDGMPVNGATQFSHTAQAAGNYTVQVTDKGCSQTSDPTLVSLFPQPAITFIGFDSSYCTNDGPVSLAANPESGSFSGDHVSENQFFPSQAGPGVHAVVYTFTDTSGCVYADTQYTTVYDAPVVKLLDDTVCNNCNIVLDADNPGASYQWSTGESTQVITVTQPGTYWVEVMNAEGCAGSDSIVLSPPVGIWEMDASSGELVVAPNPFTEFTVLSWPDNGGQVFRLEVYDVLGRVVVSAAGLRGTRYVLRGDDLVKGVYLVAVVGDDGKVLRGKVVVE